MFNKDNEDEEISFAEAYKAEILNQNRDYDYSSKRTIIILLLVAISIGLSLIGYLYISSNGETVVSQEIVSGEVEEDDIPPESGMINNIDELEDESDDINDSIDIQKDTNSNISKDTTIKSKDDDGTYLEQLAKISKEVDNKSK